MPSCFFPLYPFRVDLQYVDVYNPSKVRINYIPLRLIKIDPSLIQAHLRITHYLALGQNPGALHWTSKKLGSNLVGGIPDPLKNMKVSWDYYSQYMGKKSSKPPTSNYWCSFPRELWNNPSQPTNHTHSNIFLVESMQSIGPIFVALYHA